LSDLISRVGAGEPLLIERRSQPAAVVIGTSELDRLERRAEVAQRLALALGQNPALVEQIEAGEVHIPPWLPSVCGQRRQSSKGCQARSLTTAIAKLDAPRFPCEDSG